MWKLHNIGHKNTMRIRGALTTLKKMKFFNLSSTKFWNKISFDYRSTQDKHYPITAEGRKNKNLQTSFNWLLLA